MVYGSTALGSSNNLFKTQKNRHKAVSFMSGRTKQIIRSYAAHPSGQRINTRCCLASLGSTTDLYHANIVVVTY